jgi:hypothetical protein
MRIFSVDPSEIQSRRFAPSNSFAEATALVEAALNELREAEVALERQLSDLRGYISENLGATIAVQ